MNDVKDNSTPEADDVSNTDPSEQELLDAVMKNSPIMDEVNVPLPEEEETVQDPVETEEPEDPESEEAVSEDEEEVSEETEEEVEDEDAVEETATQEADILSADDLDLDAQVQVKIDGQEQVISMGDLIKGYQTDAHLSKQGRELGEAKKALEAERTEKLEELNKLHDTANAVLMQGEQAIAKQYHELEKQIDKARADEDDFELGKLKDKREQIQKQYWGIRNQREGIAKAVEKQKKETFEKAWQEQLDHFNKEIPNMIPDFNEKVANDIREFAIKEGIQPEILDQITDPAIVKFVDDYRRLKQGVNKGTAKRKAVPTKKALPTKKAKPATTKAKEKANMVKARAFKENASADDQMDYLRQFANKSLNL